MTAHSLISLVEVDHLRLRIAKRVLASMGSAAILDIIICVPGDMEVVTYPRSLYHSCAKAIRTLRVPPLFSMKGIASKFGSLIFMPCNHGARGHAPIVKIIVVLVDSLLPKQPSNPP